MGHGHDVEAVATRPAQRLGRVTGDPDGWGGLLHWPRIDRHVLELPEPALVVEALVCPRLEHDVGRLLETVAALLTPYAVDLEVDGRVAEADAELQPPAG
jgi:hypothetical protein